MLLVVIGGTVGVGPVAAQEQPAVRFVEAAPVTLGTKPTQVSVVNDTDATQDVTLSLSLFDASGARVELFEIRPGSTSVEPGQTASFVIAADAAATPVAASGTLTSTAVSEGGTGTIRSFRPVSATAAAAAEPAVEELTLVSEMKGLGNDPKPIDVFLPLEADASCPPPSDEPTSVVVSDGARVEQLTYTCVDADESAGLPARLEFVAGWEGRPGTYEGTVKVGTTDVALTVRRSAGVGRAIAAIAVGLALGLWWNVYSTRTQQIRRAKRRTSRLIDEAAKAQGAFDRAGVGEGREYSFTTGVANRVTALNDELDGLRPSGAFQAFIPSVKADLDADITKVVEKMAELKGVIDAWPDLAKDLKRLEVVHHALTNPPPPAATTPAPTLPPGPAAPEPPLPWGGATMAPILTARAGRILDPTGHGDPTVLAYDTAKALEAEVEALLAAFGLLVPLADLASQLPDLEPDFQLEEEDHAVWARARQLASQAMAELGDATTAGAVEQADVAELVSTARRLTRQLPPRPDGATVLQTARFAADGGAAGPVFAPLASVRRALRRVSSAAEQGRGADWFGVLLAIALAIWSGLVTHYADEAWGTGADVVIMVVWAFAVSTVAPGLITALENLGAEPTRLDVKADGTKGS